MQLGAADAGDQRIGGRRGRRFHPRVAVAGIQRRTLVGGRGEQRDALLRRGRECGVLRRKDVRLHAALVLAEAHRDDVAQVVIDRVLERTLYIGVIIRLCQNKSDVRAGSDRVRPQDVEADFLGPAGHVAIADNEGRQTVGRDLGERAEVGISRISEAVQAGQRVEAIVEVQLLARCSATGMRRR